MIEIFNPHSSCSIGSTKQPQFKWISQYKCNTFLLFQTNFRMCSDSWILMAASIAWWSIETLKQSHRANKVEAFMNFLIPNFPGSVCDSLISVDCPTQLTCCWNFILLLPLLMLCSTTKLKEHNREICKSNVSVWGQNKFLYTKKKTFGKSLT